MTSPSRSGRVTNRLILLALWLVFYASFTLFAPPLLDDADSVHAEVAREMLTRHDFTTLYANGIRYLEKAPLYYWSMAASMRLFGVSTAASRVPLALAVLALTLLLESLARRAFASPRTPLYAGLITLSSFGIFIFSRINIPDILVCLFLTAAIYSYVLTTTLGAPFIAPLPHASGSAAEPAPPLLPCLLFAAALAINVLTKGLIGIVFPIAIVVAHLLLTRGWRGTLNRISELHPLASLAVFLVIAVPWHILIALANPGHGHPAPISHVAGAGWGHWVVPYPTDGNVHGWAWFYFINEQLYRYLNLRVPHDYDTSPLWLFLGLIFIWLMPWSAFLPSALHRAFRPLRQPCHPERSAAQSKDPQLPSSIPPQPCPPERSVAQRDAQPKDPHLPLRSYLQHLQTLTPAASLNLLLLLWLTLPLAFFLFSTRQEYYVLPALPPMILLIAAWLAQDSMPTLVLQQTVGHREEGPGLSADTLRILQATDLPSEATRGPFTIRTEGSETRISTTLLILGTLLSLTTLAFLFRTRTPPPHTDLATLLTQNPADYALSFGHILDLTGPALSFFRLPLALAAFAFFAGPLASYLLRRRARPHAATLALTAASFLFLFAAWLGLRTFSPTLTSYQLAEAIHPQLHPDDLIVIHGEYEAGSTLGFYLHRNDIHILEGRSSNLWYGSFFPDAPPIFETRATLAHRWPGPQRIFLWQDPHDLDRPPLTQRDLPTPIYLIATAGGKQILSNQPSP